MLNFTLTITAAPELLAAMSNFTNSITSAKVVTVPQIDSDFTHFKAVKENTPERATHSKPTYQVNTNPVLSSIDQNTTTAQQYIQTELPISAMPMNNQPSAAQVNQVQALQQPIIQTPSTQASTVPTSTQAYTMEQLAVAATQLVDAGRRTELVSLLSSFGVQALTALPKDQYGTFATQLRALGAKI